jgi:glycosyltransferase involved in cell wall biosynthesis
VRERRAAFDSLARKFGERKESWLIAAAWLEEEVGLPPKVASIIRRLASGSGFGPPFINSLTSGPPGAPTERSFLRKRRDRIPTSVRVLGLLFDRVLGERSRLRFEASSGPAVLLTGSLGAGGAERQLVNTAIGLNAMAPAQRALEDGTTIDSVQVVARSLKDRKDGAFYLHDLQTAGIEVQSYRELPDFSGQLSSSVVRPALSALGLLPWSTAEAVIKLSDWLCARKPQVVHIWQDGLIYAAGLAALLAGVPRIVLSGRSTPPPDRRERYPIEYDIIFKSLMRAPGVTLSVNSRHAASRYASWLDLDIQKISVIPNGVEAFPVEGDAESEAAFSAFADRTRGSTLTLGAVMRLDEVKRPLLWIDAAAGVLTRVPNARFIIIGDGPLRAKMERRAQALGISCQCLFAGRSTRVGYWLSKMDAVMLLSEHEGLPNALIEAQLLGVPVITSPAGGAAETLIPNVTGIVTSASPLPSEIGQIVAALVSTPGRLAQMGFAAREWAQSAFPMGKMLANTLDLYGATSWAGIKEAPLLSRMTPVANLQYAHHASN